jgi:hypothetical protein
VKKEFRRTLHLDGKIAKEGCEIFGRAHLEWGVEEEVEEEVSSPLHADGTAGVDTGGIDVELTEAGTSGGGASGGGVSRSNKLSKYSIASEGSLAKLEVLDIEMAGYEERFFEYCTAVVAATSASDKQLLSAKSGLAQLNGE